ncbi:MAG: hypothetical protein QN194_16485, partial [Armatimonadota bacterium]|nr:hypothetical protein [Armatimonadota bacterium]
NMRIVPETKTADETGESAIRHIAIVSPYSFVRVWDLANWRELWSAKETTLTAGLLIGLPPGMRVQLSSRTC